jgi:membrane protein involved in D-alanine export
MIPFTDFIYFGISLYALLPNLVFGWFKRTSHFWIVIATGIMLVVQYSLIQKIDARTSILEIWLVLGYAISEYLLAVLFLLLRQHASSRWIFYPAVILSLSPLLAGKFLPLIQPAYGLVFVGLSYVTFRCVDVILGIQEGLIQALPPMQYLSFLLFFPTISSGPIDRYQRFKIDWDHTRTKNEILKDLDSAVHHIFTGFLYKFILASLIQTYWLNRVSQGTHFLQVVAYMYAYTFYLFFDFAGYSAFAIGFSHMFGIHPPENFNRPFIARNIRDFWNRWHISLSSWFRDHIYSRFVLGAIKGNWFKNKYLSSYLGFVLTMGLMGLWHGTAWHYLIYGLYHAGLLILNDVLERFNKVRRLWNEKNRLVQAVSILLTFQLVCFGMLIFSGHLG